MQQQQTTPLRPMAPNMQHAATSPMKCMTPPGMPSVVVGRSPSKHAALAGTLPQLGLSPSALMTPQRSSAAPQQPSQQPQFGGGSPSSAALVAVLAHQHQMAAMAAHATAAAAAAGSGSAAPATTSHSHPVFECVCPTCQYYRAAMLLHHDAAAAGRSPMEQYMMYQPLMYLPGMFSPAPPFPGVAPGMMMGGMSPQHAAGGMSPTMSQQSSTSPMQSSQARSQRGGHHSASSTVEHQVPPHVLLEQFQALASKPGDICAAACSAAGRSLLQAVIRLNQLDKTEAIFVEILSNMEAMMLDAHACHVVRSVIETLDSSQVAALVGQLNETLVLNMSTLSQYTRRILQTLFERNKSTDLEYVVGIMSRNARYLAATQQGCISLMRVFEKCAAEQKKELIATLLPLFSELACDPFGNYVVQCAFDHSDVDTANAYAHQWFTSKYLKLSCNKFASNVLEHLLQIAQPHVRKEIVDELVFNPAALQQAVQDSYANFVVQAIIDTTGSMAEHKKICDRLKPVLALSTFGHKIESKMRTKRFASSAAASGSGGAALPPHQSTGRSSGARGTGPMVVAVSA